MSEFGAGETGSNPVKPSQTEKAKQNFYGDQTPSAL
jgi:hypothetical protein